MSRAPRGGPPKDPPAPAAPEDEAESTDTVRILLDIHHAEHTVLHWRRTLQDLQNDLANQAATLLASVDYVAKLCPPEKTDDKEAIEDIRAALARILSITDRIQRL